MPLTEAEELEMLRLRKQRAMAQAAPAPVPAAPAPAPEAAPAPPTFWQKVNAGVEAGVNTAVSTAGGAVGGVAGALGYLTGNNPEASAEASRDPNGQASGLGIAMSRGASVGAENLRRALNVDDAHTTPLGQQYTQNVSDALSPLAAVDPVVAGLAGKAAEAAKIAAPAARAAVATSPEADLAARAVDAARTAGGVAQQAAKSVPARAIAKTLAPKPDPELLKAADAALAEVPGLEITPERLALNGDRSTAAAVANAPLSGGADLALRNRLRIGEAAIRKVDPEAEGRLTPTALGAGMDKAWGLIKKGFDEAGVQDAAAIQKAISPQITEAAASTDEVLKAVSGAAQELHRIAEQNGGALTPAQLADWDSRVGLDIRHASTEPRVARALSNLQDVVREHIESQVSPATKADMAIGRQRYAIGVELQPIARAPGTFNSGVINNTGDILRVITDNTTGKTTTARGAGGALDALAHAGDLVKEAPRGVTVHVPFLHGASQAVRGVGGVLAGRAYNRAGPEATRMLVEKNRPPPPPPPAPPPELDLAPQGPLPPTGGAPAAPGPLGDLTPEWQTTPGAGAAPVSEVVPGVHADRTTAPPVDAAGLYPPVTQRHEPLPAPARVVPREPVEAPPRGAGAQIPAVPGRPDLPDVAVAGPPTEIAANHAQGAAMGPALETRRAGAAQAAADAVDETARHPEQTGFPDEPKPEPPAAPVPPSLLSPAEQARVAHLDKEIAAATNPATKAALQQARAQVDKQAAARVKAEQAKTAAAELRAAAARAPDPELAKTLTAQADKLDPPAPAPKPSKAPPPPAPPAPPAAPAPKPPKPPKTPPAPKPRPMLQPKDEVAAEADAVREARVSGTKAAKASTQVADHLESMAADADAKGDTTLAAHLRGQAAQARQEAQAHFETDHPRGEDGQFVGKDQK